MADRHSSGSLGRYAAKAPLHQEAGVVLLLLQKGLPRQDGQLGEDGLKQGNAAGLGEHQIRPGHVVVYPVGETQHLDVGILARQAVVELAVVAGDNGGVDAGQGVQRLIKAVPLGQQAQPAPMMSRLRSRPGRRRTGRLNSQRTGMPVTQMMSRSTPLAARRLRMSLEPTR